MIRHGLRIVPTLAFGGALSGGVYWGFLNTPESNALMLAASALLLVVCVAIAGITVNTAVLVARDAPLGAALHTATHGIGWFVLAAAPLLLAWWLLERVNAWVEQHQGEISAWFIAQLGWADITPLLQAQTWVSRWLGWAVLPMAAVSLLAALLHGEGKRGHFHWLRRAWHWRALLLGTLAYVFLLALPWRMTAWRPHLPPTWVEPAAAALRLGIVFLLGLTGVAVMIIAAVGRRHPQR